MSSKGQFKILYALSFAWQLGFLIAVPMAILILLGLWLDKTLATAPLFTIAGILAGITISIYEIYHNLAPLISNKNRHD